MITNRKIHCIFYSHVWCVHQLAKLGKYTQTKTLQKSIFIELAEQSHMAVTFKVHTKLRYGLPGLLVMPNGLHKLATTYQHVAGPLVLAPNPGVTPETIESAAALLPHVESPFDDIFLLLHINEAEKFSGVYPYVDRFQILWDLADLPNKSFERLSQSLLEHACLDSDRWGGILLCEHPWRKVADIEERRAQWQSLLDENPDIAAA